jgi:hypothetical protein
VCSCCKCAVCQIQSEHSCQHVLDGAGNGINNGLSIAAASSLIDVWLFSALDSPMILLPSRPASYDACQGQASLACAALDLLRLLHLVISRSCVPLKTMTVQHCRYRLRYGEDWLLLPFTTARVVTAMFVTDSVRMDVPRLPGSCARLIV